MNPKVSVIIHFLNAEKYLTQAIESVFRQTFSEWELVLVDGGSTDGSVSIAKEYQKRNPDRVRALEHRGDRTLGIFSSRIWGAKEAHAPLLALLDSDDEWHPQFLERHLALYQSIFGTSKAMVYCPMVYWWEDPALAAKSFVQPIPVPGLHNPPDLLFDFIKENYQRSAGNSSVVIAREIILEAEHLIGTADEKALEDQYLWSWMILKYPIFVSAEPLVRYRQWQGSTCAATKRLQIARKRAKHLAWLLEYLKKYYQGVSRANLIKQAEHYLLEARIKSGEVLRTTNALIMWGRLGEAVKQGLKRAIKTLYVLLRVFTRFRLIIGVRPLSYLWGSDRGLPIHRYYLEQFLHEFKNDIKGHCLEFAEDAYTSRYGGKNVTKVDILHVDDDNPKATIVADLTQSNSIASEQFDCIICTHVLHVIADVEKIITELFRILKPGGVLLVATPQISMCDSDAGELWRFTSKGLGVMLTKTFDSNAITIKSYGNSLTAAGEIRGMVSYEFSDGELNKTDAHFCVEVCARAVKTFRK